MSRAGRHAPRPALCLAVVSIVLVSLAAVAHAQGNKIWVPYHSQIPCNDPVKPNWRWAEPGNGPIQNGYCTCACIEMLFDYWMNDAINHGTCQPLNPVPAPQQEIAAVANTNDCLHAPPVYGGTYLDDARRAVHFSPTTPAWPCNPPAYVNQNATGYSWNQAVALPGPVKRFGWIGIEGDWETNGWDRDDFKTLIMNFVPIAINCDAAHMADNLPVPDPEDSDGEVTGYTDLEDTVVGHSIVVYGFNDSLDVFYYHDPTRGIALKEDQDTLWVDWWRGKDFLVVAPWNTVVRFDDPPSRVPASFEVDVMADYNDPLPTAGSGPTVGPVTGHLDFYAIFSSDLNAKRKAGVAATKTYGNVSSSGDWEWKTWQCVTKAWGGDTDAIAQTWGRVSATSTSFPPPGGYVDDIGSTSARTPVNMPDIEAGDASICDVPRAAWWHGVHIRSVPHDFAPGVPNDFVVEVENRGVLPVTDVLVDLYYGDPSLAQFSADPEMHPFGMTAIPLINPGEAVETSPVGFAAPALNSFGQPYFQFLAEAHCPTDYPEEQWVESDNNVACHAVHHAEIAPMSGTLLEFRVRNPEPEPRIAVTRMDTYLPAGWSAQLMPAGLDSVEMGPDEAFSRSVAVEAGSEGIGMVDVYEDLYATHGEFERRTGGLSFLVWTTGTGVVEEAAVSDVALAPPVPNPARGNTRISFALREPGVVDLAIYDVAGRFVASVYRGEAPSGETVLQWNGFDDAGGRVASGVYFVRLATAGGVRARKLVLMR
jgi:hypothetical protein